MVGRLLNGLEIKKDRLQPNELAYIKHFYTVQDENDETVEKYYFHETSDLLFIPHLAHNVENIKQILDKYNIDYKTNLTESYKHKFKSKMKIEPRNEKQKETIDFLMNSKSNTKSLFLSPGSGKTALSIMYFVLKGLKPLIIVPDMNLVKQWIDSILQFTNIKEDEIFAFDNGTSSLKSKNFSNDKRIYICCIKTPASMIGKCNTLEEFRNLSNLIKDCKIDMKIFDECHLNLHSISKIMLWFNTNENLFLSGTMNRRLFKENLIHPTIIEPNECVESVEYEVIPNLMAVFFNSQPNPSNIRYVQDFNPRSGFDYNVYFNKYLFSEKYKDKGDIYLDMIENMCKYYTNSSKNNKIVIVGYTIKFLDCLYEKLKSKYKVNRMYSKYKEKPTDDDFQIIIGTNKMLTAGFDVSSLNIMISTFMNLTQHNVKQLLGRILRKTKTKEFSQYICLVDDGFPTNLKYFKKHKEICENELSSEHKLEFKLIKSKYEFPYIQKEKRA